MDRKTQKYISQLEFTLIDKYAVIPPGYMRMIVFDDIHLKINVSDKDLTALNITEKALLAHLVTKDHIIKKLRELIQHPEMDPQLIPCTGKKLA